MGTRSETDSFGAIDVPADSYWGAQTERSSANFPFGTTERMPAEIVHETERTLAFRDVAARLASFLAQFAEEHGTATADGT